MTKVSINHWNFYGTVGVKVDNNISDYNISLYNIGKALKETNIKYYNRYINGKHLEFNMTAKEFKIFSKYLIKAV